MQVKFAGNKAVNAVVYSFAGITRFIYTLPFIFHHQASVAWICW